MPETRSTIVAPRVSSVPSSTVQGVWLPLRDGVLAAVSMHVHGSGVPHGRVYAVLEIANAEGDVLMVPWSGYATSSGAPTCAPRVRLYSGWRARVVGTQTGNGAGVELHAHLFVEPEDATVGGGSFFYEAPGEGPGELRFISVAGPAAGADPADQTVPNLTSWEVRAVQGTLTADATAANRVPRLLLRSGGATQVVQGAAVAQVASQIVAWTWARQTGLTTAALVAGGCGSVPLADARLPAGTVVRFSTVGIQAGDQWNAPQLTVEEWAVPA